MYMNHLKIVELLTNDPALAAMGNGELELHFQNSKVQTTRRIPTAEIHEWANMKRIAKRFFDVNGAVDNPSLYAEFNQLMNSKQEDVNIHSEDAGVTGLIADWVAAGKLTAEEAAELMAMGYTEITLGQQEGISGAKATDFQIAKNIIANQG